MLVLPHRRFSTRELAAANVKKVLTVLDPRVRKQNFAELNALLCKAAERTVDANWKCIGIRYATSLQPRAPTRSVPPDVL
jgi:hypothetical protein